MTIYKNTLLQTLALILGMTLFPNACDNDQTKTVQLKEQQKSSQQLATDNLKPPPVKHFPASTQDRHDIKLLDEFDQKFISISDEIDNELAKMQQTGTLTSEFEHNRKLDHIQSALTMLTELNLKTAQGRYIQGLLYQYWENQAKLIHEQLDSDNT